MAHAEGRHGLAAVQSCGSCQSPLFGSIQPCRRSKARMNPQVFLIPKISQDGVGQAAIAYLDGVAVLDEAGHILPDMMRHFIGHYRLIFQERLIMPEDVGHVLDTMNPSPWTRGMWEFTWAMTTFALSTAAFTMSTLTPRLMYPCSSGGEVWIRATWTAPAPGIIVPEPGTGRWGYNRPSPGLQPPGSCCQRRRSCGGNWI